MFGRPTACRRVHRYAEVLTGQILPPLAPPETDRKVDTHRDVAASRKVGRLALQVSMSPS